MTKLVGRFCFLLMAALYIHSLTQQVHAASDTGFCNEVCTEDAACDTECIFDQGPELPYLYLTCGVTTGGLCENTCDTICSPIEDGGTECTSYEGQPSTCYAYGVYLHCGDGYCATGHSETCGNCGDCICSTPATIVDPVDPSDPTELCSALATAGSIRSCSTSNIATGSSCETKSLRAEGLRARLENLDEWINYLREAKAQCSCSDYDVALAAALAESFSKTGDYLSTLASHCYPLG